MSRTRLRSWLLGLLFPDPLFLRPRPTSSHPISFSNRASQSETTRKRWICTPKNRKEYLLDELVLGLSAAHLRFLHSAISMADHRCIDCSHKSAPEPSRTPGYPIENEHRLVCDFFRGYAERRLFEEHRCLDVKRLGSIPHSVQT